MHRAGLSGHNSEMGSARLKFIVVVLILGLVGFCLYQYIPVAYQASLYKDKMQWAADNAAILGLTAEWVTSQLRTAGKDYNVPQDAQITIQQSEGRVEVRVQFTRDVVFPGYTYKYEFDQTVKSTQLFKTN